MSTFQKAERRQVKLKVALTGPSGSGKTYSGLLIAAGLGKRIAVIDTENGSASLYADAKKGPLAGIQFDTLDLKPPYTIQKYTDAITAAEQEGYDVLLIDSISHAWAGEGGLLSKKEALDARGGRKNNWTNWAPITKEHEAFKARLLNAGLHLVCTMRSKQDYVLDQGEGGKTTPRKVGMAPVQRDGMEYEFTVVLDLAMDHNAVASKDRTDLFEGMVFKPSRDTAKILLDWLAGAKPAQGAEPATEEQLKRILLLANGLQAAGVPEQDTRDRVNAYIKKRYNKDIKTVGDLTQAEADAVIDQLNRLLVKTTKDAAGAAL